MLGEETLRQPLEWIRFPKKGTMSRDEVGAYQSHVLRVAKKNPELNQGQASNPSDREQTNPLDADSDAKPQTGHDEPEPPARLESLGGAELLLVGKRGEGKGGKGSSDHQRGVEEDQSRLGQQSVLWGGRRG